MQTGSRFVFETARLCLSALLSRLFPPQLFPKSLSVVWMRVVSDLGW